MKLRTSLGLSALLVATATMTASGAPAAPVPAPVLLGADHSIDSSDPSDARPRIESNVAVDPRNPKRVVVSAIQLAVSESTALTTGYRNFDRTWTSSNGGASYTSSGPLPPQPGGVPASNDPTLAWDPHGPLYASYTSFNKPVATSNTPEDGLYVARSVDGGAHWQRRAHVEGFSCAGPDRSTVAVDPVRGWVYLTWVHYVESACNGSPDMTKTVTRFARSTDGGAHFSRPVDVTVDGESAQLAPAVLPDGTLLVAYVSRFPLAVADPTCHGLTGTLKVARYRPDGRLLDRRVAVSALCSTTLGLSPNGATYLQMLFPSVAVNASTGRAVIAVIDDLAEQHGVAVATSGDAGRTWATQVISGLPGSSASMPAVAPGPRGRFALAWLEIDPGGTFTAQLAASPDGSAWSAPVALATLPSLGNAHPMTPFDRYGFGHYLGVAVGSDSVAHVAWPDLRPKAGDVTDTDIWTRQAQLP